MFNLRTLFPSIVKEVELKKLAFTPDWDRLQDSPGWLFFEYGEFKKGFACHELLETPARTHCYSVHRCPLFVWNDRQATFPIAMDVTPTGRPIRKARIGGELYLIPTEKIPHLDNYRMNTLQFLRKKVRVQLPNQEVVRAFSYVGNREHWKPMFDWSDGFFRGRENSSFQFIEPHNDHNKFKTWNLGWHSTFTKDHYQERPTKCYIGLYPNGVTVDTDKQAA